MTLSAKRPLRLLLGLVLLVTLPVAGALWAAPATRSIASALCLAGFIAAVIAELLARSAERETKTLHLQIDEDERDVEEWKERVRLLDGVTRILRQDGRALRKGVLVGEIDPEQHLSAIPKPPQPDQTMTEETAGLLALPAPDQQMHPQVMIMPTRPPIQSTAFSKENT